MKKYENFEDWFDELENYSLRSDRFYEEWHTGHGSDRFIEWLKAAWNCAREEACPYCSTPELAEVFFDQTCSGCVDRMEEHTKELR